MDVWKEGEGEGGNRKTYGGSGGPDAVEHIDSQRNGHDKIFRVADAHHIARFLGWEPVGARIDTEFASF